jgi:rhodanese-related sulfurtransferase
LSAIFKPEGLHPNRNPVFIDVISLAQQIKNREALTVVDIRSTAAFKEFHIPSAINVQPDEFITTTWDGQNLIIYSGDDNLARQLWNDLPQEVKASSKFLYGGVHDWFDRMLYPHLPLIVDPRDSVLVERINLLSLFYGGQPEFRTDSATLDYYKQDFSRVNWPTVERKGKLVRKGC